MVLGRVDKRTMVGPDSETSSAAPPCRTFPAARDQMCTSPAALSSLPPLFSPFYPQGRTIDACFITGQLRCHGRDPTPHDWPTRDPRLCMARHDGKSPHTSGTIHAQARARLQAFTSEWPVVYREWLWGGVGI